MILIALYLMVGMFQMTQTAYEHQPASHTQSVQNAREVNEYQGNTEDTDGLQPAITGKMLQGN